MGNTLDVQCTKVIENGLHIRCSMHAGDLYIEILFSRFSHVIIVDRYQYSVKLSLYYD